ncbi:hypothetical protein HMPREF0673_01270 [Leyella stercorea DSM 18206]|uniref:Uncharacterized protein n=1 Tax=Leyella stercorea DSM 18206 TaxID=1002367 RepID=G6AXB6_9BACT|nr:hypothetical protein HMPREF0673_01270 [Leyella stercorea DSM 18206]
MLFSILFVFYLKKTLVSLKSFIFFIKKVSFSRKKFKFVSRM